MFTVTHSYEHDRADAEATGAAAAEAEEAPADLGQRRLSAQMMRYWANFAHAGDPNRDGFPHWSPSEIGS
ncbi:MAG TPA: hypothetical protein VI094_09960 [Propionibacteriaceae bacterium]